MAGWTVGQVVDRVVALGLTDRATADKVLAPEWRDWALSEYGGGDSDPEIVTALLVDLGVGFDVDPDDTARLAGYTAALTAAAACTGGLFTVADIELAGVAGGPEVLRFRRNGEPVEWRVDRVDDGYLDGMAFAENIDEFTDPGRSPRRWAQPVVDGELIHYRYVFADPATLEQLGREFDVEFDRYPD